MNRAPILFDLPEQIDTARLILRPPRTLEEEYQRTLEEEALLLVIQVKDLVLEVVVAVVVRVDGLKIFQ